MSPPLMLAALATLALGAGEPAVRWDFAGRRDLPPEVRSYFSGGAEGTVSPDPEAATPGGTGALRITVARPSPERAATAAQVWFEAPGGLAAGTYAMKVLCRSSVPVAVGCGLLTLGPPYTPVSSPGSHLLSVSPQWQQFEWPLTVPPGYEAQPLRTPLLLLGRAEAPCQVWIASITLTRVEPAPAADRKATSMDKTSHPLVGAIRWDAWHTPWSRVQPGAADGPVKAVQLSLSPGRYHWRLPFFAEVVSPEEARIDGYTQQIVDREIGYAQAGGLDYWAFLLYEEGSAMSQGLSLYLSSSRRRDVGFCAIAGADAFGGAQEFARRSDRLLRLMAEPGYVKVAGGRPLVYVFRADGRWIEAWGGAANARRLFAGFREAARAAGTGDPYLVAMNDSAEHGRGVAEVIGADAITAYAIGGGDGVQGTPYARLAWRAHQFWDECAETGRAVVPLAMSGWDRRPRVEHPVPWETKWQQPNVGLDRYYATPTPQELAAHIADAMHWAAADPTRCPAQATIVYAWNEHDEGGWLCPTRGADGSPDTSRLDALRAMRRECWGE